MWIYFNIGIVFGGLIIAGKVGNLNRNGQSAGTGLLCNGHQGVFTCTHPNPNTICNNIASFLTGRNAAGIFDATQKVLLELPETKSCNYENPGTMGCLGTAVDLDITCIVN